MIFSAVALRVSYMLAGCWLWSLAEKHTEYCTSLGLLREMWGVCVYFMGQREVAGLNRSLSSKSISHLLPTIKWPVLKWAAEAGDLMNCDCWSDGVGCLAVTLSDKLSDLLCVSTTTTSSLSTRDHSDLRQRQVARAKSDVINQQLSARPSTRQNETLFTPETRRSW